MCPAGHGGTNHVLTRPRSFPVQAWFRGFFTLTLLDSSLWLGLYPIVSPLVLDGFKGLMYMVFMGVDGVWSYDKIWFLFARLFVLVFVDTNGD